jgi:hypothetical protein
VAREQLDKANAECHALRNNLGVGGGGAPPFGISGALRRQVRGMPCLNSDIRPWDMRDHSNLLIWISSVKPRTQLMISP